MKSKMSSCVVAVLMTGLFFAATAGATTKTIYATANSNGSTTGSASMSSASKVTCTSASGGGTSSRCFIQAPGWSGLLTAGQSIGTSGPGTVTLSCTGTYPVGGSLSCSAKVDDTTCSPEQTLSGSANWAGTTQGLAAIKGPAIVECTFASGGGTSSRCFVTAPGFSGLMLEGQTVSATGAGTVVLGCAGSYPVGGSLSCNAQVSQICP